MPPLIASELNKCKVKSHLMMSKQRMKRAPRKAVKAHRVDHELLEGGDVGAEDVAHEQGQEASPGRQGRHDAALVGQQPGQARHQTFKRASIFSVRRSDVCSFRTLYVCAIRDVACF